jgi:hypothetical protein
MKRESVILKTNGPSLAMPANDNDPPTPEAEYSLNGLLILPDAPLRLGVAVELAFPDGSMSVSGLRKEAERGRLKIERIAGKDYTTLANIKQMRNSCRVKVEGRACGGGRSVGKAAGSSHEGHGLSSTVVSITPQAALLAKIEKRKSS